MIGAILGDMIGAPYEFDRGNKTKEFSLFSRESKFTDDTVMTVAVAEALMDSLGKSDEEIRTALIASMRKWGRRYPYAGYGGMFHRWLNAGDPKPYGSFGNGSAMRVSSAGWLCDTLEETRHIARLTAEVTHNHPEGIKGAEAAASAIFLARTGYGKKEIKAYIQKEFGYDLSRTCDEIRPDYFHIETCQKTVPEAITAFMEGTDFEDVIRTAVSLGGDCDTLTCIAGGIAEAFYGIPAEIEAEGKKRLPKDMLEVVERFQTLGDTVPDVRITPELFEDGSFLKKAIEICNRNQTIQNMVKLAKILRDSLVWIPCNAIMSDADYEAWSKLVLVAKDDPNSVKGKTLTSKDSIRLVPDILQNGDDFFFPVFTSAEEMGEYGEHFSKVQKHFLEAANLARNNEKKVKGIVINAFSEPFVVPVEMFDAIEKMESSMRDHGGSV
ncbi:MAG: ADP-ribosylglycohydrolase family protein [Clostridia bacterium]|nr:ADP-ribosylglycohydrolase family protein [Clostridia bacterium]